MLFKKSWLLMGIMLILLISAGLGISSCTIFQNQSNKQAVALGLTPGEFEILDTATHEYLYQKYPFLRDTEFGIRYKKVDTEVEGTPPNSLVIDAYANFRTPPVVVRAALYDGNVEIISEKVLDGDDA